MTPQRKSEPLSGKVPHMLRQALCPSRQLTHRSCMLCRLNTQFLAQSVHSLPSFSSLSGNALPQAVVGTLALLHAAPNYKKGTSLLLGSTAALLFQAGWQTLPCPRQLRHFCCKVVPQAGHTHSVLPGSTAGPFLLPSNLNGTGARHLTLPFPASGMGEVALPPHPILTIRHACLRRKSSMATHGRDCYGQDALELWKTP